MITRREFLEVAGATAISSVIIPNLGHFLPFTAQNFPAVTDMNGKAPISASQKALRVAHNWWASYQRADPADAAYQEVVEIVNYFKVLGYTHYLYVMQLPNPHEFSNSTGHWKYMQGHYRDGKTAASFRKMKEIVESPLDGVVGMQMIPVLPLGLSHMLDVINNLNDFDTTLAEFESEESFDEWIENNGMGGDNPDKDKYTRNWAFVGDYTKTHRKLRNKCLDELYLEYLRIIKWNWGNSRLGGRYPKYIHIGHDELGVGWACAIKADRSKDLKPSKSELVAAEISERLHTIKRVISPRTRVMIYGDSFVPHYNGEVFGLIGDPQSGEGGVLQILRDRYRVAHQLIVMPWGYRDIDGDVRHDQEGREIPYSKVRQICYLDRLGIPYIPCSGGGKDSLIGDPDALLTAREVVERTKQTTFEWIKVSQMYPKHLSGFAHLEWQEEPSYISDDGLRYNYAANLLAYLAWTYDERSLNLARRNNYGLRIFSRVHSGLSSQERQWIEGVHYWPPPLCGILLTLVGQ